MWPVVVPETPNTIPGDSGHQNEPQSISSVEAQVALQQAQKEVGARLKMAVLFQQNRAQLNNYSVTITSDPASTEERIKLTVYENKKIVPLTVKNSGVTTVYLTFWASDLVKNIFTLRDCQGNVIKSIKQHPVRPGEEFKISVHFYSQHAGFFEQLLVFKFETGQQASHEFEIMRLLEVTHWTSSSEELFPTNSCNSHTKECTSTEKHRDISAMFGRPVVALKGYAMPDYIKNITDYDPALQRPLEWSNYSERFHLLLHLEEFQMKKEIEIYNEGNVPIFRHKRRTDLFILQMPGVLGDLKKLSRTLARVSLVDQSVVGKKIYIGWVQYVAAQKIYVQFDETFQSDFKDNSRFSVDFALDRLPLRVQHRAVASVKPRNLVEVLFPTGKQSSHNPHLPRLLEFESNPEQRKAIKHIIAGTAKPAPYLVFGPPGTGKTVTLVGAINQILETQESCKILACAPSNNAIDHLCEKIAEGNVDKHHLYRLYAATFPVEKIPYIRKFHCNLIGEAVRIPTKRDLMRYKIIFTTLQTAGRLVAAGIPVCHFSYIFVDEAGQTTETECLIPISGLMDPGKCQVVLAGDPKQLGPVISSRMAEDNGFGLSMLERLMRDIDLYKSDDTHGFNNHFITKLLRNYRSHPAILKIPNRLFYKGELQAFAHVEKCIPYCKWELLPKKDFPLIFHGVAGTDEHEANCPSAYNMAEVEVLKEYLKAIVTHLHKNSVTKIGPKEIGIITPYSKQVEKIQNAIQMDKDLKEENLENIMVGSVEQFQGKEFNVVILSTVRSFPKLTSHKQCTLGFIDNEKRFNVALTRARALLIVVGDPRILKTAQIWNKFIHYCYKEGGYRGISVYDAEEEEDTDSCTLKEPLNLQRHSVLLPDPLTHLRSLHTATRQPSQPAWPPHRPFP
ncbi:putative helicase mov-10-B.1 [Sparus aurata]|uniref:putative helicase mov-10-B.1 n=1 Tax=Sparus aurata TaxID=8175 RepID=UPI0011C1B439|nr:putative helicase mov-10-B.1 [Sparus aurata]